MRGGCSRCNRPSVHTPEAPRSGRAAGGPRGQARRRAPARLAPTPGRARALALLPVPQWLAAGNLLVVNTSGTLDAALSSGDRRWRDVRRVHLSTELPGKFWVVEVRRPAPVASLPLSRRARRDRVRPGRRRPAHAARAISASRVGGGAVTLWIAALQLPEPILPYLQRVGRPIHYSYVRRQWAPAMYQTVFATEPGSAECRQPRSLTANLVTRLVSRGIRISRHCCCTPASRASRITNHRTENVRVPPDTADRVNSARRASHQGRCRGHDSRACPWKPSRTIAASASPGEGWTAHCHAGAAAALGHRDDHQLHEPRATHLAMVERVMAAAGAARPASHLERAYRDSSQGICGTSSAIHA